MARPADGIYPVQGFWRGGPQLEVRPDGLLERWRRSSTFTPWDQVRVLGQSHDHAVLWLADRNLRLDRRYDDWPALVALIAARTPAVQPPAGGEAVTPETICRWLGVAPGGNLTVRVTTPRWLLYLGLGIFLFFLAYMIYQGEWSTMGGLVQIPLMIWAAIASAERVTADGHGLSVRVQGRPRRYAWSQIEAITNQGSNWEVVTTDGGFKLSGSSTNAVLLSQVIGQAIAARAAGMTLPSTAPLPEGALSRPGEGEEKAELGLSRVAAEPAAERLSGHLDDAASASQTTSV